MRIPPTAPRALYTLCAVLLGISIGSCTVIERILEGIAATCGQSSLTVTTADEGTDPEKQLCVPGQPCTLHAALNTAAFCGGSKTIVLAADTTYTLTRVNRPPSALENRERVQEARAQVGNVGLPRILGTVTIEGNDAVIERSPTAPPFRFFHVTPAGSLTLRNVVLRQGAVRFNGATSARGFGGAVYNEGILVTESVAFRSSSATATRGWGRGGAVYNKGTFTAHDTLFEGNSAAAGGALWNEGGAMLSGSRFTQNPPVGTSRSGSAIYHHSGTLDLEAAAVWDNGSTTDNAEALYIQAGTVRIDRSTFSTNQGLNAGGIMAVSGTLTIQRSTFHGQRGRGTGALRCDGTSTNVVLQDVTIAGNEAEFDFGIGGVSANSGCALTVSNTIVALNTAAGAPKDCGFATGSSLAPVITRDGVNLDSDGSCGFPLTAAPGLQSLADNGGPTRTMLPAGGSPVVDAGRTTCLPEDQRGLRRPAGAACDLGAVESGAGPT